MHQGNLGGVGGAVKHGLAKKYPIQCHTVQAADQARLLPDLDGMRVSQFMHTQIGYLHISGNPCAVVVSTWCGAGLNNLLETAIEGYLKAATPECFAQTAGDFQFVREQDGTWIG